MDDFTRKFYLVNGLDTGTTECIPVDTYTDSQIKKCDSQQRSIPEEVVKERALVEVMFGGTQVNRKTRQYLENDGKILTFQTYWDDDSEGGFRHFFDLHWFLADDTIELIETFSKTASCAATRHTFLKRAPIDILDLQITQRDLIIGEKVTIGNRELFIYDCDAYTRDYYMTHLNIHQRDKLQIHNDTKLELKKEDLRLIPRKPRIDTAKLEHTGTILRFKAKKIDSDPDRDFIIGFYPEDDSIAVWEIPIRNSGIIAGKFAERGAKLKSDSTRYTIKDFEIGDSVVISATRFKIIEADEFTVKWLMKNEISLQC